MDLDTPDSMETKTTRRPRILFIDPWDSFANSIVALLRTELDADVEIIKHDDCRFRNKADAFTVFLHYFDAVVAGPGPGHPGHKDDVGLIKELWRFRGDGDVVPVLGICLGFQSLCLEFGAEVGGFYQR
jgi:para-aminobenzoate synthetase